MRPSHSKLRSWLLVPGLAASVAFTMGNSAPTAAEGANRVYEQVSPAEKNAADVIPDVTRVRASRDGSRVLWASLTGFGDAPGIGVSSDYFSSRDDEGAWHTHGVTAPQDSTGYFGTVNDLEPIYALTSPDLSWGIFRTRTPLTDAPNVADAINLYRRSDLATSGPASYTLLTDADHLQGPSTYPNNFLSPRFLGASADGSKVVYESRRSLTSATPTCTDADPDLVCPPYLYKVTSGVPHLVGILPASEGGGPAPASAAGLSAPRGVSQDGSRVVFTVPSAPGARSGTLYLHDDHGTDDETDDTVQLLNVSERSSPDPAGSKAAEFWAASNDLSVIYFTTAEQLTDDDKNGSEDVYRYDINAAAGSRLTRVSVDTQPDDGLESNCVGIIGSSADGSFVYFVTGNAQLVAGGPTGATGGPFGGMRIFVAHTSPGTSTLREVGAVNVGTDVQAILRREGNEQATARVTDSGRYLVFVTNGTQELLSLYGRAEYNHGDTCGSAHDRECNAVYVYDATANGGAGDLRCASCNPTGAEAVSDASFGGTGAGAAAARTAYQNHPLTETGLVFFDSADQLQPSDANTARDVYEYDTGTHALHLISQGTGSDQSTFLDASDDGRDVFFTTRDQLRSTDKDQSRDLYDARLGGVADPGLPPTSECEAESCRPSVAAKLGAFLLPSEVSAGPGDALTAPGPDPLLSLQSLTRHQRRSFIRKGRGTVKVYVSQPGTVWLTVKTVGNHGVIGVQKTKHVFRSSGSISVALVLSTNARRALAVGRRVHVRITGSYSQSSGLQTLSLVLNRKGR